MQLIPHVYHVYICCVVCIRYKMYMDSANHVHDVITCLNLASRHLMGDPNFHNFFGFKIYMLAGFKQLLFKQALHMLHKT